MDPELRDTLSISAFILAEFSIFSRMHTKFDLGLYCLRYHIFVLILMMPLLFFVRSGVYIYKHLFYINSFSSYN